MNSHPVVGGLELHLRSVGPGVGTEMGEDDPAAVQLRAVRDQLGGGDVRPVGLREVRRLAENFVPAVVRETKDGVATVSLGPSHADARRAFLGDLMPRWVTPDGRE